MLRLSLVVTVALAVTIGGTGVWADAEHHEGPGGARPVTVLLNGDPWCEGWLVHEICWVPVRQIVDLLPQPVHVEWEDPAIVHVITDFDRLEEDEEFPEEEWGHEQEEEILADEQEWREHELEMELDDDDEERVGYDIEFALMQLAADREHAEHVAQMLMAREQEAIQHAREAVEEEIHLELERELKRLEHERVQVELEAQARLHRELAELEHAYHQTETEIRLDLETELRGIEREQEEVRHYLDWVVSWDPDEAEPEPEGEECEETESEVLPE